MLGEGTVPAGAGTCVHVPKGTLHTFKNVGTSPSRVLGVITPGGFERFFLEAGEPATEGSSAPEGEPHVGGSRRSAGGTVSRYRHPPDGRQVFVNAPYGRTTWGHRMTRENCTLTAPIFGCSCLLVALPPISSAATSPTLQGPVLASVLYAARWRQELRHSRPRPFRIREARTSWPARKGLGHVGRHGRRTGRPERHQQAGMEVRVPQVSSPQGAPTGRPVRFYRVYFGWTNFRRPIWTKPSNA